MKTCKDIELINKENAEETFVTGKSSDICDVLVSVVFYDPDWRWVQTKCIELIEHKDSSVRGLAITCFGHLARIHHKLDLEIVVPLLNNLRNDPELAGRVDDTMDDIKMFLKGNGQLISHPGGELITRHRMILLLLEACPDFKPQWNEFLEEWRDELEIPYYIALGEFAHHLIDKLVEGDTKEFTGVFRVVENLHIYGDSYVKEAATVGLLEGIQNIMGNSGKDPEMFRKYLLPETTKWWDKLNLFWSDGKIMTDD